MSDFKFINIYCPKCGNEIMIPDEMIPVDKMDVVCPSCKNKIEVNGIDFKISKGDKNFSPSLENSLEDLISKDMDNFEQEYPTLITSDIKVITPENNDFSEIKTSIAVPRKQIKRKEFKKPDNFSFKWIKKSGDIVIEGDVIAIHNKENIYNKNSPNYEKKYHRLFKYPPFVKDKDAILYTEITAPKSGRLFIIENKIKNYQIDKPIAVISSPNDSIYNIKSWLKQFLEDENINIDKENIDNNEPYNEDNYQFISNSRDGEFLDINREDEEQFNSFEDENLDQATKIIDISKNLINESRPPEKEDQKYRDLYKKYFEIKLKISQPTSGLNYDNFFKEIKKLEKEISKKIGCTVFEYDVKIENGKSLIKILPIF